MHTRLHTRPPNTVTGFSRYGYLYASTSVTLAKLAYETTNFHLIRGTMKPRGLKKIFRQARDNERLIPWCNNPLEKIGESKSEWWNIFVVRS